MNILLSRPSATLTLFSLAAALLIGTTGCSDDPLDEDDDKKEESEEEEDGKEEEQQDAGKQDEEEQQDAGKQDEEEESGGGLGLAAAAGLCAADAGAPEVPEVSPSGDPIDCGTTTCQGAKVAGVDFAVEGCCVDEEAGQCGMDMSFVGSLLGLQEPGCEAVNLPGSCDSVCAPSEPIETLIELEEELIFPGCCQENGRCGYYASIAGIGFGCISPTRFSVEEGIECNYSAED